MTKASSDPHSAARTSELAAALRERVQPFSVTRPELGPLLELIGEADYVLLGEATHGTHEFYALRAALTKRLIMDKGFTVLAIEGDWPDAHQVHRYISGDSDVRDVRAALSGFARFPVWMWQNVVVLELVEWLRDHNRTRKREQRVGFYGVDLYSLSASIAAVLEHLERASPEALQEARERYGCFDSFGGDPQRYGYVTSRGYLPSCEEAVVEQLLSLLRQRAEAPTGLQTAMADEQFFAEHNARIVKNAEHYYRAMYRGGISAWNLRDTHMADTVDALCAHLRATGRPAKAIVWAHNSHLGDARATELGAEGELNVGQLLRQRHPGRTFTLGFSTYDGQVTAASGWDEPPQRKTVRPALSGSYEALFHAAALPSFLLRPSEGALAQLLGPRRLQRAIGVVYRPETERRSHYFQAQLTRQFDALIHVDRTSALEPLAGHGALETMDLPETYPSGL